MTDAPAKVSRYAMMFTPPPPEPGVQGNHRTDGQYAPPGQARGNK